jgi:hypothetical protein
VNSAVELPAEVRAELRPGETVIWAGQPDVRKLVNLTVFKNPKTRRGLSVFGLLAFVLVFNEVASPAHMRFAGPLAIGGAVFLALLAVVYAVLLQRRTRALASVFYVLTGERVIVAQTWPRLAIDSASLDSVRTKGYSKIVDADGSGTIKIGDKGFAAVPNVAEVAAALDRVLNPPAST